MAACRAALVLARAFVQQTRAIYGDVLLPHDLKRSVIAAEIDGVAAGARGFSANGAVATHEGVGMRRFEMEPHGGAVAGAFEFHGRQSNRMEDLQDNRLRRTAAQSSLVASKRQGLPWQNGVWL